MVPQIVKNPTPVNFMNLIGAFKMTDTIDVAYKQWERISQDFREEDMED
jgi:hypothetical protein